MKGFFKLIIIYFLRFLCRFFYVFKIKNNRIVFFSHKGEQYSCSPMYISESLLKENNNKLEIIWLFKNVKKYSYLKERGYKLVKYSSLKRVYYQITSKICINNIGTYAWIPLRKNQIHINTWHGGGAYKRCALGEKNNNKFMKKTLMISAQETNYFLSSCKLFSEKVLEDDFGYKGNVLNIGLPRNDIFFNKEFVESSMKKVKEFYKIPEETVLILFAPTWRYFMFDYKFDSERILNTFRAKTKKECYLLIRYHHLSNNEFKTNSKFIINGALYPNMQELLCASDVLITDYSSCIWDFCLLKRNIFMYAPDIEEYTINRGFHVDPKDYGFLLSKNMDELEKNILETSFEENSNRCISHLSQLGSYENGTATKNITNFILEQV